MKNEEYDSFVILENEEENSIKEDLKLKKNESEEENNDSIIISYPNIQRPNS